jgi:uncharacterized protein YpmS
MPVENMDVNANVSDDKKTWWQMHRLKILIALVLIVAVIIFLVWFMSQNNTIPSKNSIKTIKKRISIICTSSSKLIDSVDKCSLSRFVFDLLAYSSRWSSNSEY